MQSSPIEDEIHAAEARHRDLEGVVRSASEHLEAARIELGLAQAEVASIEAKLSSLYKLRDSTAHGEGGSDEPAVEMADLSRTDAIVRTLRDHGGHMSINEVLAALKPHDSKANYQVVATTLNYLVREQRVTRASRGRYAAP